MAKKILLIGGCGYIGSRLYERLKKAGRQADTLDLEKRGNGSNPDNIKMDYADAPPDLIAQYDAIVLLAAHGSVQEAARDPEGALYNNVLNPFRLWRRLSQDQLFIYGSSGSVYSGLGDAVEESERRFHPQGVYDVSKFSFDALMQACGTEAGGAPYVGLRFGTLAGPSPNLRREVLVINAMTISAILKGEVHIFNASAKRSILGIGDCARAIETIIDAPQIKTGLYNLASFDTTIREIGEAISGHFGVPLIDKPDTVSYDYLMTNKKFCRDYGFQYEENLLSLAEGVAEQLRKEKAA